MTLPFVAKLMRILLFHKPKKAVVSTRDEQGRRTVFDLLPAWARNEGWMPVGRLDRDSRGLLLFVQDGRLLDRLTQPGAYEKTYEVWVRGHLQEKQLPFLLEGIPSPVGLLRCVSVKIRGYVGPKTRLEVTLDEGKNREIRRLFAAFKDESSGTSLKVLDLKRIAFGGVTLDVPSGQWRFLTDDELQRLK